jgi:peptide chain release factor 2
MAAPGFWDSQEKAQKVIQTLNHFKSVIGGIVAYRTHVINTRSLIELYEGEPLEDDLLIKEISQDIQQLYDELDGLEVQSFLSGPHDKCNAVLTIHAGAGGTESCDWAAMLMRLYMRWAERKGYKTKIEDLQDGQGAGISHATIRIIGEYAYGYAKAERGVHRLVRISPFDANKRRHTSFSSVEVIAEIEDDAEIEIKDEDLRLETHRSQGKGGQHVNKTESAVRITHIPSGIVVNCQSDRSQVKNRAEALKILRSRLYEKIQDEKRAEMERFYGEKGDISWSNQIRNYVFQPYQIVKDLRTGFAYSNTQAVMDGDIDGFIYAWLRAGCPMRRNKDIEIDDQ